MGLWVCGFGGLGVWGFKVPVFSGIRGLVAQEAYHNKGPFWGGLQGKLGSQKNAKRSPLGYQEGVQRVRVCRAFSHAYVGLWGREGKPIAAARESPTSSWL